MTSQNPTKATDHRAWRRGYTAALAALSPAGEDTIFDEVVDASGEPDALIDRARKDGAMRWSGLSGYVRREKERT